MQLKPKDLKIDTYTNSTQKVLMVITHLPTGSTVKGDGIGQCKLRKQLIEELTLAVNLLET